MSTKNIGLIIILFLFFTGFYFYSRPVNIKPAQFNWDNVEMSSSEKDTIQEYFEKFPNGAHVAMAILDQEDIRILGLRRESGQFDPITNKDQYFEIGSITKTFTTALLSKFDRQGIIRQTDLLKDYVDISLKSGDNNPNDIQLGHLANHTSGLPRLPGNIMTQVVVHKDDPYKKYDAKKLMEFLEEDLTLSTRSGHKYVYSNLGIGLLGHVLSKKMGKSYEELILDEICAPLGLNHTIFEIKEEPELIIGIDAAGEQVSNWNFDVLAGCGALKSTLSDMVVFTQAQMSDTSYLSGMHQSTHQVGTDRYVGTGWHIMSKDNKNVIWHNGGTGGYTSCIAFDKEHKKAVITLTNVSALAPQGAQTDKCTFAILKMLYK